jgi:hypothetical protein|tara:strand:- start:480 stop:803 length:324 start_codon:yes stop_codon:yes gene_type:complete
MAATVDSTTATLFGDLTEMTLQLSSITADSVTTLSHGGPSGATPYKVTHTVVTAPTSRDPIGMSWEGSSTSNNTVDVRLSVPQGGDITAAVVKVYVAFKESASGGIS